MVTMVFCSRAHDAIAFSRRSLTWWEGLNRTRYCLIDSYNEEKALHTSRQVREFTASTSKNGAIIVKSLLWGMFTSLFQWPHELICHLCKSTDEIFITLTLSLQLQTVKSRCICPNRYNVCLFVCYDRGKVMCDEGATCCACAYFGIKHQTRQNVTFFITSSLELWR